MMGYRKWMGLISMVVPILAACVTTEPYPEGWTALPDEPPEGCRIADGFYANRSKDVARGNHRLGALLSLNGNADLIRFTTDEKGTVTLAAVRYGEVISQRVLATDTDQVQCKAGWLLFDTSGWVSNPAGSGFQSTVVGLLFTQGYLVVKRRDSFAGWAYILPAIGRGDSWYRYEWFGDLNLREMQDAILEKNKRARPYY